MKRYTILTHWPPSSCVVILLAYTTQRSILWCGTLFLCILRLLHCTGVSIDSACGEHPSHVEHSFVFVSDALW